MKARQTPGPWDPEFPAVAQGWENEDMAKTGKGEQGRHDFEG